jgi:hypothetical protein
MIIKLCRKCGHEQKWLEDKNKFDRCRQCSSVYQKEYNIKHKEKIRERHKRYDNRNSAKYSKRHENKTKEKFIGGLLETAKELVCTHCKKLLPYSDFTPNFGKTRGASYWCKECVRIAARSRKDLNQENGLCRCGRVRSGPEKQCDVCKDRDTKVRANIKMQIITAYGGKCQCIGCDVAEPKFLTIDHIFNDGAEHRKQINPKTNGRTGQGVTLYRWLIKNNFPKDRYQLLCWNCNLAKAHGGCPHLEKGK